jgi:hypothetical protein
MTCCGNQIEAFKKNHLSCIKENIKKDKHFVKIITLYSCSEFLINYSVIISDYEIFKYYVDELEYEIYPQTVILSIIMGKYDFFDLIIKKNKSSLVFSEIFNKHSVGNILHCGFKYLCENDERKKVDCSKVIKILNICKEKEYIEDICNFSLHFLMHILHREYTLSKNLWDDNLKIYLYEIVEKYFDTETRNKIYSISFYNYHYNLIKYLMQKEMKKLEDFISEKSCYKTSYNNTRYLLNDIIYNKSDFERQNIDTNEYIHFICENFKFSPPDKIIETIIKNRFSLNTFKYLFDKYNIECDKHTLCYYLKHHVDLEIIKFLIEEKKCKYIVNEYFVDCILSPSSSMYYCKSDYDIIKVLQYFNIKGDLLNKSININSSGFNIILMHPKPHYATNYKLHKFTYNIYKYIKENSSVFDECKNHNISVDLYSSDYIEENDEQFDYKMIKRSYYLEKICGIKCCTNFMIYDNFFEKDTELINYVYEKNKNNIKKYINNAKMYEIQNTFMLNHIYNIYKNDNTIKNKIFLSYFESLLKSYEKKNSFLLNGVYIQFITKKIYYKLYDDYSSNHDEYHSKENGVPINTGYNILYPISKNLIVELGDARTIHYFYSANKDFTAKTQICKREYEESSEIISNKMIKQPDLRNQNYICPEIYKELKITDPSNIKQTIKELQNINLEEIMLYGETKFVDTNKYNGKFIGEYTNNSICSTTDKYYCENDSDGHIIKKYYLGNHDFYKGISMPPYVFIPFDFSKEEIWGHHYDKYMHYQKNNPINQSNYKKFLHTNLRYNGIK